MSGLQSECRVSRKGRLSAAAWLPAGAMPSVGRFALGKPDSDSFSASFRPVTSFFHSAADSGGMNVTSGSSRRSQRRLIPCAGTGVSEQQLRLCDAVAHPRWHHFVLASAYLLPVSTRYHFCMQGNMRCLLHVMQPSSAAHWLRCSRKGGQCLHGTRAPLATASPHLRRRLVAMCLRSFGLFFQPASSAAAPLLPWCMPAACTRRRMSTAGNQD